MDMDWEWAQRPLYTDQYTVAFDELNKEKKNERQIVVLTNRYSCIVLYCVWKSVKQYCVDMQLKRNEFEAAITNAIRYTLNAVCECSIIRLKWAKKKKKKKTNKNHIV